MAQEIERKFRVINDDWREGVRDSVLIRQGYLAGSEQASVRVRLSGDQANLNIKSATLGVRRTEYEYAIPVGDANDMLDQLCDRPLIEKTRYYVPYGDHLWEVDVFCGDNDGLVVAEIELAHEHEAFARPPWVGDEVSHDPRYYNVCLVKHPFKLWKKQT